MENIIIYTNETCPYCQQVKEEFKKSNIDFVEKSTHDYKDEWQDISMLTGIPNVPTIVYKDNYFVPGRDFHSSVQLVEIINNFKNSTYPINIRVLEKIKTLVYSMHMAFGRTDQILKQIETKLNKEE